MFWIFVRAEMPFRQQKSNLVLKSLHLEDIASDLDFFRNSFVTIDQRKLSSAKHTDAALFRAQKQGTMRAIFWNAPRISQETISKPIVVNLEGSEQNLRQNFSKIFLLENKNFEQNTK